MRYFSFDILQLSLQYRRLLLFLLFVNLISASCSRRHMPVSTPVIVKDAEMWSFISSGTQNKLNTRRIKPNQVIRSAERYLGTPHCMGGTSAKCLDCSGLTYISFGEHRISLPRRSQDQARYGRIIVDREQLKRGDLVFFTKSYKSPDYITHVGIYIGSDKFLHVSTSSGVIITPLSNPWWSERFVFGTRVF